MRVQHWQRRVNSWMLLAAQMLESSTCINNDTASFERVFESATNVDT
jgi:hypothetical protein